MLRFLFIIKCGIVRFLCAMHVFEVRTSSSSPRLPLCQILFLSRPPLLSWPTEKNRVLNHSITHSLNQSPSLFDAPGNRSFRFGIMDFTYTFIKLFMCCQNLSVLEYAVPELEKNPASSKEMSQHMLRYLTMIWC